jgi:membrane-bound lytic murein transglycosylase D
LLQEAALPEELGYLVLIESSFLPPAVSPSGAAGLWQFVPGDGGEVRLAKLTHGSMNAGSGKVDVSGGGLPERIARTFRQMVFSDNPDNAGQGTIKNAMRNSEARDFWDLSDKSILRDETRDFVPKYVAAALITTDPQQYGLNSIDYDPH